MRKAIKVTVKNKQLNPKYLNGISVGQHVIYTMGNGSFPKVWRTQNWVKEAFEKATAYHEEAGFYEVEEPQYSPETQYLGAISLDIDKKKFVYQVVDYTQEELDEQASIAHENNINEIEDGNKFNAQSEWRKVQKMLRQEVVDGNLTDAQVAKIKSEMLLDIYPVFTGDWDACWYNLNKRDYALVTPVKVKVVCEAIKAIFIDFFNSNYQKQSKDAIKVSQKGK